MFQYLSFISGGEILIVLFIIVLLFGADKLPDIARTFGKGYREVQKATEDIKQELTKEQKEIKKDIDEIKKNVQEPHIEQRRTKEDEKDGGQTDKSQKDEE
jgi:sec-independent protein translocase protein TatA